MKIFSLAFHFKAQVYLSMMIIYFLEFCFSQLVEYHDLEFLSFFEGSRIEGLFSHLGVGCFSFCSPNPLCRHELQRKLITLHLLLRLLGKEEIHFPTSKRERKKSGGVLWYFSTHYEIALKTWVLAIKILLLARKSS